MNQTKKNINPEKLFAIIKKRKISQSTIAEEMGMKLTTFKNKLNPNQAAYNFTEAEYADAIVAVGNMISQVQVFVKAELRSINRNSKSLKK